MIHVSEDKGWVPGCATEDRGEGKDVSDLRGHEQNDELVVQNK